MSRDESVWAYMMLASRLLARCKVVLEEFKRRASAAASRAQSLDQTIFEEVIKNLFESLNASAHHITQRKEFVSPSEEQGGRHDSILGRTG